MPKVIYASSKNSDMSYATRAQAHDPFFFIEADGKKRIFLDQRELGIFLESNRESDIEALLIDPIIDEALESDVPGSISDRTALVIFRKFGLMGRKVEVPSNFPLDMADFLRSHGALLIPMKSIFPERSEKSEEEIGHVRESIRRLTKAYDLIEAVLRESVIEGDMIEYQGSVLTSERLKREVERELLGNDLLDTEGMIISCGSQSAIPHHSGSGPLRPHQTIICDIFPKDRRSGYYADMTRTYVKGKASDKIRRMHAAVLETQEMAISEIRAGRTGKEIHELCARKFVDLGYHAGDKGFIHGTGHGLGIDIHEEPYMNRISDGMLKVGSVVSVEPGLYYPEIGGVRIEDIVAVTEGGCDNLTNYKKELQSIP